MDLGLRLDKESRQQLILLFMFSDGARLDHPVAPSDAQDDGSRSTPSLDCQIQQEPGEASTTRRPANACSKPRDRCTSRLGGSRLHPVDWTSCGPHVSVRRIGLATD